MEDKWAVILWEYGRHCDEFIVKEIFGPMTFDEANKMQERLEEFDKGYVKLATMKGE